MAHRPGQRLIHALGHQVNGPTRTRKTIILSTLQFALNPIQWNHTKEAFPRRADPSYRLARQTDIYNEISESGFPAVMLELIPGQTLQNYEKVVRTAGLRLAPGIVPVPFPEDLGQTLAPGSVEYARWFDPIRRLAEASNYFGLKTAFLCPHMPLDGIRNRDAAAVGRSYDRGRLDRVVEVMAEAGRILSSEGILGGLHNHVGTWIETQYEVEYVLDNIDEAHMAAAFDIGHLEWVGADTRALLRKYRHRITDLHIKDLDLTIAARTRTTPGPYFDVYEEDFFLEPGRGGIDFPGILSGLPEHYEGWIIVEVDRTSMTPKQSAQASWRWVERQAASADSEASNA